MIWDDLAEVLATAGLVIFGQATVGERLHRRQEERSRQQIELLLAELKPPVVRSPGTSKKKARQIEIKAG